ncbi:MAG: 16S rRNA (cytosine(1402)-N(4))-methyltransferase RsmH [Clostridium sp.]|nr:16S rRNA (cytosine(1402)-N(4))-methyltransferase RsmH [Prevotella sp.]MCM1429604.1 16S rRNA (cytosine(1402)-N(4))-methyltransferase RsmH [Clostridium sp.]MCM1476083.1 16S rRNA (cytosine(1402)-N(4))-methyltransferase RsmH [Muribaculaceae bacterium]
MTQDCYHIPALLEESISALNIKPNGIYADATFGGGGHSRAILQALGEEGRLLSFDQDMDTFNNRPDDRRFTFVHSNFRHIANFMRYHGIDHFDGILADLGVSFHHFDASSRGFSFRNDAPLDMRMNQNAPLSAADLLETSDADRLTDIFRTYSDLKHPRNTAMAIVNARKSSPIDTTGRLAQVVAPTLNPKAEKKDLAQVFQSIRIAVNHETDALRAFLLSTPRLLRRGGRLAILTYHSIEDRMVKNFMRSGNLEGIVEKDFFGKSLSPWRLVGKNPIIPTAEEIERNPRARSAKLRVAEYLGEETTNP